MVIKLLHKELAAKIVTAATSVLTELKPGLDEKLYERALAIELRALGLKVEQQKSFPVRYKSELIGTLTPHLVVEDRVLVDVKVVGEISETHLAQLAGHLAITGIELALLLNFKNAKLEFKRVAGI